MKVVGITGGIGAGKTTVSEMIKDLGYIVFNCDDEAKGLYNTDSEVIIKMKSLFGNSIYGEDGLDKKQLSSIIFNDENQLAKVNSIIHPKVRKKMNNIIDENRYSDLVFVESAILFESGLVSNMDFIVNVTAPENVRIERVCKRDGVTKEQVKERIKNQLDDTIRNSRSDYTIDTNQELGEIKKSLEFNVSVMECKNFI